MDVTSLPGDLYRIAFKGPLANANMPQLNVAPATTETQRLSFSGNPDGGSIEVTMAGGATQTIFYSTVPATLLLEVQNKIAALIAPLGTPGTATVTGGPTDFDIVFTGQLALREIPPIVVTQPTTNLTPVGVAGAAATTLVEGNGLLGTTPVITPSTFLEGAGNSVQTLGFTGTGLISLAYNAVPAPASMTYDATTTPTTVKDHIESIPGIGVGNVPIVLGNPGGPYTVVISSAISPTFNPATALTKASGAVNFLAGTPQVQPVAATAVIGFAPVTVQPSSEVQRLTFSGTITGGSFTLSYGTNLTTTAIPWDAVPANLINNIQTRLDAIFGAETRSWPPNRRRRSRSRSPAALASANLAQLTAANSLTGGSVAVSTIVNGTGNTVETLALERHDRHVHHLLRQRPGYGHPDLHGGHRPHRRGRLGVPQHHPGPERQRGRPRRDDRPLHDRVRRPTGGPDGPAADDEGCRGAKSRRSPSAARSTRPARSAWPSASAPP